MDEPKFDLNVLSQLKVAEYIHTNTRGDFQETYYYLENSIDCLPEWTLEDFLNNNLIMNSNGILSAIWHNTNGPVFVLRVNDKIVEYQYRWYDMFHRYDGPAMVWIPDEEREEVIGTTQEGSWYIKGCSIGRYHYLEWLDEMGMDIHNLTDEDKILIDLKWVEY